MNIYACICLLIGDTESRGDGGSFQIEAEEFQLENQYREWCPEQLLKVTHTCKQSFSCPSCWDYWSRVCMRDTHKAYSWHHTQGSFLVGLRSMWYQSVFKHGLATSRHYLYPLYSLCSPSCPTLIHIKAPHHPPLLPPSLPKWHSASISQKSSLSSLLLSIL